MMDRMESVELLGCPFCGGSNVDVIFRSVPLSKWRYTVECKSTTCGASGSVGATKVEAIENWNTRTSSAGAKSVDTLRKALESIRDMSRNVADWRALESCRTIARVALAAPPAAAQSVDDVPSCGQENDYRRAAAQSNEDADIDKIRTACKWLVEAYQRSLKQPADLDATVAATANNIMAIRMMVDERAEAFVRKELEALIRAVRSGGGAERERDEARQLVIEANNSLYGSQGYFHSLNGGEFDRYHLARGIEELKSRSRQLEATRKALEDSAGCVDAAEAEGLHESIEDLRGFSEHADRLINLVERRLMSSRNYAQTALAALEGPQ